MINVNQAQSVIRRGGLKELGKVVATKIHREIASTIPTEITERNAQQVVANLYANPRIAPYMDNEDGKPIMKTLIQDFGSTREAIKPVLALRMSNFMTKITKALGGDDSGTAKVRIVDGFCEQHQKIIGTA